MSRRHSIVEVDPNAEAQEAQLARIIDGFANFRENLGAMIEELRQTDEAGAELTEISAYFETYVRNAGYVAENDKRIK